MEKIIFVGPQGSGKTTLAKSIVDQFGFIAPHMTLAEITRKIQYLHRACFDGVPESLEDYMKIILQSSRHHFLTHLVCNFQKCPEWLTPEFVRKNNIKLFELAPAKYL